MNGKRNWGDTLFRSLIAPLTGLIGFLLILLLRTTIRFRLVGFGEFSERKFQKKSLVVSLWHNQLLFMPFMWSGRWGGAHAIVSRSRDGELIAAILRFFGIWTVRGSSTRGGTAALKQILSIAKKREGAFFVTPDGPLGPPFRIKEGAGFLTYRPDVPMYCMSVSYTGYRMLGSWDGFVVPFPFSTAYFVCSPPIYPGRQKNYSLRLAEIERGLHIVNEASMALSTGRIRPEEAVTMLNDRFSGHDRKNHETDREMADGSVSLPE